LELANWRINTALSLFKCPKELVEHQLYKFHAD
jgi:hypothetical protein